MKLKMMVRDPVMLEADKTRAVPTSIAAMWIGRPRTAFQPACPWMVVQILEDACFPERV